MDAKNFRRLHNVKYYDIETVPCVRNYNDLPRAMQECWEKSYCRYKPEEVSYEDYFRERAALTPEFAQIVAITFGVFDVANNRVVLKNIYGTDEKALLEDSLASIKKTIANQ